MILYKIPVGTVVYLYCDATNRVVRFTVEKEVWYDAVVDWKTWKRNTPKAERIKKQVREKYGEHDLDLFDLPENDRNWTHILVADARKYHVTIK
jgi:hypothetical protein